jgi:hypothetical protein
MGSRVDRAAVVVAALHQGGPWASPARRWGTVALLLRGIDQAQGRVGASASARPASPRRSSSQPLAARPGVAISSGGRQPSRALGDLLPQPGEGQVGEADRSRWAPSSPDSGRRADHVARICSSRAPGRRAGSAHLGSMYSAAAAKRSARSARYRQAASVRRSARDSHRQPAPCPSIASPPGDPVLAGPRRGRPDRLAAPRSVGQVRSPVGGGTPGRAFALQQAQVAPEKRRPPRV